MTAPADTLVERLEELRRFLDGSAPLDGAWFGDLNPIQRGAYWWRVEHLKRIDEAVARIRELEAQVAAADRAIGDHHAPADCYSTGPLTGDPIADLVECPACAYLNLRKESK